MQRSIAILLALLFHSWLLLPGYFASSSSNLPSCCRTHGEHHCMQMQTSPDSSTPFVGAIGAKCPYRSTATVTAHADTYVPGTAGTKFAGLLPQTAVVLQAETASRVSLLRSNHKRGPPALVLS